MRVWLVLAAGAGWLGCGFSSKHETQPSGDAALGDASPDSSAELDAGTDTATDAPLPVCATDPTYTAALGANRYRVLSTSVDYDTAVDHCAADGAHLAVVDDGTENTYLSSLIAVDVWIGYDDLLLESSFRWVTDATSTFTAFSDGEPNDNGTEDCTYMRPEATWNDTDCSEQRPAICECDVTHQQPPTPACRTADDPTVLLGRRYFIRMTPLSWSAAEAACTSIGAHLVAIGDADEDAAVDQNYPADSWIGYSDRAVEGTFAWVNQAPAGYTDWQAGAPASGTAGLAQDCVELNIDWDDTACTTAKPYTCECDPNPR